MYNIESSSAKSLSISCVYYDTRQEVFEKTLTSIAIAITFAKQQHIINNVEIHLINNNEENVAIFFESIERHIHNLTRTIIHNGHGNIGYGRANNIAIAQTQCDYHLILNPDVVIAENALATGIDYLNNNLKIGLVAPHATNPQGEIEYLAKRMPTFLIIIIRGLNNKTLNRLFKKKLDAYAYKNQIPCNEPFEIELASGCFMLCNTRLLKTVGGFSSEYFLYFEDFDLVNKIRSIAKIVYLPTMKIIHFGGYSANKGLKHKILFMKSAFYYFWFQKHVLQDPL